MIRAVVFDMDGVLIDAKDWHYEALNRALRLFGFEIGREEHLETYDGLPTGRKLEILSQERGLPRGLHAFINELKQEYTIEMVHTLCRPKFVHQYALSRLKQRGYVLAVASNSIRESVDLMMERAQLAKFLDLQISATDVVRPKPDPEIYRITMERLGVRPDETLVVEDNQNGIRAAQAAGAHVLVVDEVHDVNLDNIMNRISEVEAA